MTTFFLFYLIVFLIFGVAIILYFILPSNVLYRYKKLKQLKRTKVKTVFNLKTFARIDNETREIEVSPRFKLLTDEMKHFVILQLQFMPNSDIFRADERAIEEIMKLYPKRKRGYWIKEFALILFNERPD